jgi:RecA/RadA recombinase
MMQGFEFAKELFKINDYSGVADSGIVAGDYDGFIDSGSYTLNALLSGTIYGGYPKNKITALAAPSSCGKTFFMLTAMKIFLNNKKDGAVFLYESESAISKKLLEDFGIDTKRVFVFPVETVQQFRFQCLSLLTKYGEQKKEERKPLLIVLDSLGMLSTAKEIADITEGKDTVDMTRAKMIKGAFRVLTLKIGRLGATMLLSNHTYASQGLYPVTVSSGGTGLQYAASTIVMLSKMKDKVGTDIVGNIIHCKLDKSRLTKEFSKIDTAINYKSGLLRWHGMIDLALSSGVWKKGGSRVEMTDGSKAFEKAIYADPERYFTPDVLEKIDAHCKTLFLYGNAQDIPVDEDLGDLGEEEILEGGEE